MGLENLREIFGPRINTALDNQISNFIMFYERLTKHMLKTLSKKSNSVINIDKSHKLKSIKFN